MKTVVPDYYTKFRCIAEKCRHSCCVGWEIDIDSNGTERFMSVPEIAKYVDTSGTPHIILDENEKCPFLRADGLCDIIINRGEDFICDICRDHPRFRNYWSGITEMGIGLVCEEAARIILTCETPMKLVVTEDDGIDGELSEEEIELLKLRDRMLGEITETGPKARLKAYLIFRHLADAMYDGMVDERIRFIGDSYDEIVSLWEKTDGSIDEKIEAVRKWSYDVEYDDEVIGARLDEYACE